jgi:predicted Zn-dependent protease
MRESGQYLSVRKNVAEPPSLSRDEGAMLTVVNGVEAYAATNDLSQQACKPPRTRRTASSPTQAPRLARPERPAVSTAAPITSRRTSTSPS